MGDSIKYSDYYQLTGEAAEGAADRWLKAIRGDMTSRLAQLGDPEAKEAFRRRADSWVAGHYENLLMHERREVRKGKLQRLEAESERSALSESMDMAKNAAAEDADFAERLNAAELTRQDMAARGEDGDGYFAAVSGRIATERQICARRHLLQIGAAGDMAEERFRDAAAAGLFDDNEATMRIRRYRRGVVASTVQSLLDQGLVDRAEDFISVMEAEDGPDGAPSEAPADQGAPAAGGAPKRRGFLAGECGFDAAGILQMRSAIRSKRAAIEAMHLAEKEAQDRQIKTAAQEEVISMTLAAVPQEPEGRAAHFRNMANQYRRLAGDKRLDATSRQSYASAAVRIEDSLTAAGSDRRTSQTPDAANDIYSRIQYLLSRRADASISDDDARKEQAGIYTDIAAARAGKRFSGEELKKIEHAFLEIKQADKAEAMRYVASLFGATDFVDKKTGAFSEKELLEQEGKFYIDGVQEDGVLWNSDLVLSAKDFFGLLTTVWKVMDNVKDGTSRLQMAKDMARELKAQKLFENNRKFIEAAAESLMRSQVNQNGEAWKQ